MRNALPFVVLTLALVALPVLAHAQKDEETAAPGSIAIGMIEEADAEGVFEVIHNGQVSVRHVGSGLRCDFERDGEGGSLALFPGLPRGDDVACDYEHAEYDLTVYASRRPGPPPLDSELDEAVRAIRYIYPTARTLAPANGTIPLGAFPPQRRLGFIITIDGVQHFSSVHVAQVGAWTIKQRYTAPAVTGNALHEADLMADSLFAATLAHIVTPPNL